MRIIGMIHRRSSTIALSMSSLGSEENRHHAEVSTTNDNLRSFRATRRYVGPLWWRRRSLRRGSQPHGRSPARSPRRASPAGRCRTPCGDRRGGVRAGDARARAARMCRSGKYRNGRRAAVSSIVVASPPCTDRQVAGGQMTVEVGHIGPHLEPLGPRQCTPGRCAGRRRGSCAGPAPAPGLREARDHAAQQRRADARAADRDDAHTLVVAVPELRPQRRRARRASAGSKPVMYPEKSKCRSVQSRIPGRPGPNRSRRCRRARRRRSPGRARAGSARSARSSRRCSRRSGSASRSPPSGIGMQPTKSVSHTYGARSSARGSRAGSSRAPRPRRRSRCRRARSRTTSWKIMKLASRISSMRRSASKQCSSWLRGFAPRCVPTRWRAARWRGGCARPGREHRRDRVLGEPVDLEVGVQPAQLGGDRQVAAHVPEPDRRGDVQSAPAARAARAASGRPRPGVLAGSRAAARFTRTGSRALGMWPAARQTSPAARRSPRRARALRMRAHQVLVAVQHERRDSSTRAQRSTQALGPPRPIAVRRIRPASAGSVSSAQPTQSSICLVECGSLKHFAKKNVQEVLVVPRQ